MKRIRNIYSRFTSVLVIGGLLAVAGCMLPLDISEEKNATPLPVTVIAGKIIDTMTKEGVPGLKVSIKVDGAWKSVYTAASNTGENLDTAGDWALTVPNGSDNLPLLVEQGNSSTAYISFGKEIETNSACQNIVGDCSIYLGNWNVEKGVAATIYVIDSVTSAYVTRTSDALLPIYRGIFNNSSEVLWYMKATRDTTDDVNKYTINIPAGTGSESIYVPAIDTDDDGVADYSSGVVSISQYDKEVGELTKYITVNALSNTAAPAIVSSNLTSVSAADSGGSAARSLGVAGVIKYFFNMPIALVEDETSSFLYYYNDNLKTLAGPITEVTEVDVTPSLSMGNTLLTLTPAASLTENESYSVQYGSIKTRSTTGADEIYGADEWATFGGSFASDFLVYRTGSGSIGSTPSVIVDNWNYCNKVGATSIPTTVGDAGCLDASADAYLVFPEPVWGEVQVLEYTSGETTTPIYGNSCTIENQGADFYTNYFGALASTDTTNDGCSATESCSGSNYADIGFRVPLFQGTDCTSTPISIHDNSADSPATVKLSIDVYDSEGNTYRKEATFNIQ